MSKGNPTFNIKKVNDIRISDYPVGKIIDEPVIEPDNYIYPLEYLNNRKLEREIDKETEDYFEDEQEGYEVCSYFGCGKKLRPEEILAGGRCHEHTNKKRK